MYGRTLVSLANWNANMRRMLSADRLPPSGKPVLQGIHDARLVRGDGTSSLGRLLVLLVVVAVLGAAFATLALTSSREAATATAPSWSRPASVAKWAREELRRRFWFTKLSSYDLARPESILEPIWRRRAMKAGQGHPLFGRS